MIPYVDKDGPHFSINEYPWFTFNYADLHAHYFDQPLALLMMALAWALFHQVRTDSGTRKIKIIVLLGALVCGAQIMTNTWDVPAYFLLLILSVAYFAPQIRRNFNIAGEMLALRTFRRWNYRSCCSRAVFIDICIPKPIRRARWNNRPRRSMNGCWFGVRLRWRGAQPYFSKLSRRDTLQSLVFSAYFALRCLG